MLGDDRVMIATLFATRLMIPYSRTDVYRNLFSLSAIRLWNQLPETIEAAPTLNGFVAGQQNLERIFGTSKMHLSPHVA